MRRGSGAAAAPRTVTCSMPSLKLALTSSSSIPSGRFMLRRNWPKERSAYKNERFFAQLAPALPGDGQGVADELDVDVLPSLRPQARTGSPGRPLRRICRWSAPRQSRGFYAGPSAPVRPRRTPSSGHLAHVVHDPRNGFRRLRDFPTFSLLYEVTSGTDHSASVSSRSPGMGGRIQLTELQGTKTVWPSTSPDLYE